jgi:hypothetical protein
MSTSSFRAYLLTIAALALAILPLRTASRVVYDPEPGIRTQLPAQVGSWRGEVMRFCVNPTCQLVNASSELDPPTRCTACGGPLDDMARAERVLLPRDTWLRRSEYRAPDDSRLMVTLVLSGRERASIHRPEVCLSGEGSEIIGYEVIMVPRPGQQPLALRLLTRRITQAGGVSYSYLAYWFVAKDRETESHYRRMLWMAEDRIFRGLTRRWAYVSIAGAWGQDREETRTALRGFVRDLHPQLTNVTSP